MCTFPSLLLPPSPIWGFIRTRNLHGGGYDQPNSSLPVGLGIFCLVSALVAGRWWIEAATSVLFHRCIMESPEYKTS